ncbi:hypothetical protein [Paenarthrobacter aurescens]|uniref:hypothetical protein n=1 Tax=Paenarthrobacter aurescens TaxID=43663 RepID=UPI00031D8DD0|nr:hypothetical protein [Paenarthrobacter aurescens]
MASISFDPSDVSAPTSAVSNPFLERGRALPSGLGENGTPGFLPESAVVQELFRRWPLVPSRELIRIRRALLQCRQIGRAGGGHELSEPALALLELVTAELERRRKPAAGTGSALGGGS